MKPNWFVGLPVPAQTWLPGVLATLPEQCRGFVPSDVHMTVAFLGPIGDRVGAELVHLIEKVDAPAFEITLGKLMALPKPKHPSALSFSVAQGREQAVRLMRRWRDRLIEAASARPDTREPLPHITIARPIRRYKHEGKQAALDWCETTEPPHEALWMDRIALYTWAEDRRQQQFQIVAEKKLT